MLHVASIGVLKVRCATPGLPSVMLSVAHACAYIGSTSSMSWRSCWMPSVDGADVAPAATSHSANAAPLGNEVTRLAVDTVLSLSGKSVWFLSQLPLTVVLV